MKKLFLILFSLVFASSVYAHGVEWFGTSIIEDNKWTPLQISLWPVHLCDPASNVYGIAISPGLVGGVKRVYGISCGIIFLQDENNGLTAGILPTGKKIMAYLSGQLMRGDITMEYVWAQQILSTILQEAICFRSEFSIMRRMGCRSVC